MLEVARSDQAVRYLAPRTGLIRDELVFGHLCSKSVAKVILVYLTVGSALGHHNIYKSKVVTVILAGSMYYAA